VAHYKDVKIGDEVWIKEPSHIYAKVTGVRQGDAELPLEERRWKIEIRPSTQFLLPGDFELIHPPTDPDAPHKYLSKEWTEELAAFRDSATRYLANNADETAMTRTQESLRKLGFIKPK